MARIQPARNSDMDEPDGGGRGRRKAVRYAVPVAVAGIAAATIGLVPALADSGDPSLPSITAQQLLAKVAASHTQTVDGTVKVSTDLGLPSELAGAGGMLGGAGPRMNPGGPGTSPAAPQSQLTQLLAGTHTLHVAADGPDKQKISIIEPAAEYSLFHDGNQLWAYDSASDQAYHQVLPQDAGGAHDRQRHPMPQGVPTTPQEAAQQVIDAAKGTASITVDGTARVAGHSAYELLITPQHADHTTVGGIRIAIDAKTGVPLRLTVTAKSGGKAVFDIGYTKVSFAAPAASTFTFTPPKGVKVTEGADHTKDLRKQRMNRPDVRPTVLGKGWDAIAVIKASGGMPPVTGHGGKGDHRGGQDAGSMLNRFGQHVTGSFGSGTVFHTRLINVLMTDNGTVYVGAVTQSALVDAANAAAGH